jgi:hypothetical protein
MSGRWRVLERDAAVFGTPWLVLRGRRARRRALERPGPRARPRRRATGSGPTSSPSRPDYDDGRRLRAATSDRSATRCSTSVSSPGIGNVWKVESLWDGASLAVAARRGRVRRRAPACPRDAHTAHAARARRRAVQARACLPPQGAHVPALRHAGQGLAPGGRRTHGVLVPGVPERRGTGRGVSARRGRARSAALLGPEGVLPRDVPRAARGHRAGAELAFAFEEHTRTRSRRCTSTAARQAVHRAPGAHSAQAARRAARSRGIAAPAGGDDLRARACRSSRA